MKEVEQFKGTDFFVGQVYGATAFVATTLVVRKLLVGFCSLENTFGAKPFEKEVIIGFYQMKGA